MGNAFQIFQENIAGALRVFRAPAACSVSSMRDGAAPDLQGQSPWIEVERIVLQDALTEATKIFPPLKMRVFGG